MYNIVKGYRKTLNAFGLSNQIDVDSNESLSKSRAKIFFGIWLNQSQTIIAYMRWFFKYLFDELRSVWIDWDSIVSHIGNRNT